MNKFYRRFGKRVLDLAVSLTALALLSPVLLVLALLIRLRMGRPVIFTQERPGRDGRPFTIFKFRTMRNAVDHLGQLLPDGERMTGLGGWLRRMSLDELPELVNVLRGEMSLVGPRPLRMDYLELYSPQQARRHEVLPGITGWAQVNGRNSISWEKKFELDVWYVDHMGFWLDLRLLAMTLATLVSREGITAHGHASMPNFTGSQNKSQ
jgi:lipopolysaccharide/colanic/teichoic acid biosynthesis glycosyltransferase